MTFQVTIMFGLEFMIFLAAILYFVRLFYYDRLIENVLMFFSIMPYALTHLRTYALARVPEGPVNTLTCLYFDLMLHRCLRRCPKTTLDRRFVFEWNCTCII